MNGGSKLVSGLAVVLVAAGLALAGVATQAIRLVPAPDGSTTVPRGVSASVPAQASPKAIKALVWSVPVRVIIPAISVNAPVTEVGLNQDRTVQTPTPGTLGVSVFLGRSAFRVLYVFLSLFSWWCRRRAGTGGTRVSRRVRRAVPRSAAPGRGRFLLPDGPYPGR